MKVGDVLVIHYRTKFLTVRVAMIPERILPSLKPAEMYEIVDERKDDAREWLTEHPEAATNVTIHWRPAVTPSDEPSEPGMRSTRSKRPPRSTHA